MNNFVEELAKLNPKQREAVETIEGPVLVVAGPGTGKTQVLATRIANILDKTDAGPANILCITFTEAGAAAMRNRLFKIIGKDAYYVNINTYHGFCNEVIQSNQDKFPEFGKRPTQLNDLLRLKLMQRIIDELDIQQDWELKPFHDHYARISDITKAIQTLKREGVEPAELKITAEQELTDLEENPQIGPRSGKPTQDYLTALTVAKRNVELAQIYADYQRHLEIENYYDYEDMIMSVIKAFEQNAELLHDYLEQYHYILVDEYQDTNGAQNELVALLGQGNEGRPNLFAVGDDDQAIYRFQGANVENVLFFNQKFEDVKVISIDTNYRSNQAILNAAQDSIDNNANRLVNLIEGLSKLLKAGTDKAKLKPQVYRFSSGEAENRFVVRKIKELIDSGVEYKEIAVIYRQHKDADDLVEDMLRAGLPLNIAAGGNALDDFQVRRLLKLLRLIGFEGAARDSLMFEVLFYDFLATKFSIERLEVFKLVRFVNDHNRLSKKTKQLEIFDVLQNAQLLEQAVESTGSNLGQLANKIIEWNLLAHNQPLSQFIAQVLSESGFLGHMLSEQIDVEDLNALNSFYSFIKNYTREQRQLTLKQLIQDLDLLEEYNVGVSEQSMELFENGVNMLTAHSAKGLEFEYVFIIKCFDKHWGGKASRDIIKLPKQLLSVADVEKDEKKDLNLQDERRLFYVAMTRAKQQLFVSSAEKYLSGTSEMQREESRFTSEINQGLIERPDTADYEEVGLLDINESLSPVKKVNLQQTEEAYLKRLVGEFRLSASALNEYLECPLKFKFNRLLKIPIPASKHLALGNATHYALEGLNRALLEGQPELTAKQVQDRFRFALQQEQLSAEEHADTLREGIQILQEYMQQYGGGFVEPAAVEKYVYSVPLEVEGEDPIILTGKIDKLEWVDKEHNEVKVVDYKTSSYKSEGQIKGTTKNSDGNIWRQLVFYKLLADLDPNFRPENKMEKYRLHSAEVDFLKSDKGRLRKVELEISDADVEQLKQEIVEVMRKIRNLEFYNLEDNPKCADWDLLESLTQQSILTSI